MKIINTYHFEGWFLERGVWKQFYESKKNNLVVTTGLNEIQKFWKATAANAALFVGIIDNASFSAIALTNTAAQIGGSNGWLEFTGYSETTRQALTLGSIVAGAVDNSTSPCIFTVTSAFTLNGGFVVTSSVKAGTAGVLIGATSAAMTQAFTIGQQVRIIVSSTLSN